MKRSEVEKKYLWALEDVYASDDLWEKDYKELDKSVNFVSAFKGKLSDKAKLLELLKKSDETEIKLEKLYSYARMRLDQDSSNNFYAGLTDRAQALLVKYSAVGSYINPELCSLDEKYIESLISDPDFSDYDYMLKGVLRRKKHTLGENEEKLMSMAQSPLSQFQSAFSKIDNVDVQLGSVKVDGKKVKLTHGTYAQLLQNPDQNVRKAAFTTYYKGYENLLNTLTAVYAGSVKSDVFSATARGYKSCLEAAMFNENVPECVYTNLIESVDENCKYVHDYVAYRKNALGVERLNMYDMYVPIVEGADMSLPFEEAFDLVKKGLSVMGDEYAGLLQKAHDERWMDVYETENKRSGAYSWGSYSTKPFVLLNYSATIHDIFTIAHELGHSMHSYYSNHTQPYSKAGYAIFVAEVASTVNEVLLLKYLLGTTTDKKMKKYLLSYYLDMFRTTLFRQTMFAEFEKISHDMEQKGKPLTPKSLSDAYMKLNKKYYGPAVTHNKQIATEWARIPHFYNAFYVYKYATGITSAVNIANSILKDNSFVAQYKKFLSAGGSDSPYEILKIAGVDLATRAPFDFAMNEFKDTLEQLKAL
mgnify:FL=1